MPGDAKANGTQNGDVCNNCGREFTDNDGISCDEIGPHSVCPECEMSSDRRVDLRPGCPLDWTKCDDDKCPYFFPSFI